MFEVNLCDTFLRGKTLCFKDFIVVDENKIMFSACNYNGLYQYDWVNSDLQFLGCFKNENLLMKSLHSKTIRYGQWCIFIPYYAREINIYDLKKNIFYSWELPLPKYACHAGGKFQTAEWYNNKLYLIPERYSYILEIDFIQEQMQLYDEWNTEKLMHQLDIERGFGVGCMRRDRFVCLPLAECNIIFEFDLDSKRYSFITVETEYTGFRTLACIGDLFYVTDSKGRVVCFSLNGKNVNVIGEYETQFYQYVVIEEKYIVYFSNSEDKILAINTKSGEQDIYNIGNCQENWNYDNWEYDKLWFVKKTNSNKIVLMDRKDRTLKLFDIDVKNNIKFKAGITIFDDTRHADEKVDINQYYNFWIEYHNEVTQTLGYRKPFVISEKFSAEDALRFVFWFIGKECLQKSQTEKKIGYIGSEIWKGLNT